jgi:chromate transporter
MMLLLQLFFVFLYIGALSFGGGNAMYPLLSEELVRNHHWLTPSEMVDLFALAQMTPGPVATNAATYVGFKVAGFRGAAVSTIAVSIPSILVMVGLVTFAGNRTESRLVAGPLFGLRPMVTALILAAAVEIGGHTLVDAVSWLIFLGAIVAAYYKINPALILLAGGIVGLLIS